MNIFSIFTLCGGLAFFLFGMNIMSKGLEKMAGGKLEKILKVMTANVFKSMTLGIVITIAIQSSSAVTVMLVGLVNSGIMTLGQSIGIIMGSNIGTTLTAWLLSLVGIESSNIFIQLFKPESFAPIFALIGIIMIMTSKKVDLGNIFVGFAILMFGMQLMSGAVKPLANMPEFTNVLIMFNNPLIGVLVGTVFTGIIQSSAASIGILQALSLTGGITYAAAIPIIMGQNIGTCVTSLLSSIGTNKNAKRVAIVHISFNVIGTILFLIVYFLLTSVADMQFFYNAISPIGIALSHSVFNIVSTLILLPFRSLLEKVAQFVIREKKDGPSEKYEFLDERLLLSPSFAIAECENMTKEMAVITKNALFTAIEQINNLEHYNSKAVESVKENENITDMYEDKLGTYLVKLSSKELSIADSERITKLLHLIGDIERIADHSVEIISAAQEMAEKKIYFSSEARKELKIMSDAVMEIIGITVDSFKNNDLKLAANVEPLEQVIDYLRDSIKARHVVRLQQGLCTIELGFILSDLLANYERISDHCSNIAVCMIKIDQSSYETHLYLNERKASGELKFMTDYNQYKEKYTLPKQ